MILRLDIKNYAIIESLEIEPSTNLNIITGETGSGKSILLGALSLILGKRADSKALLQKDRKCIVEGVFNIENYSLKSFFTEHDLDYAKHVLIRREINSEGKSRAFINDTPVNLKTLQKLSSQLVDLHEQFENLGINDKKHQIKLLDAYAMVQEISQQYQHRFATYKDLKKQLYDQEQKQIEALKHRDYLQFQLDELQTLRLNPDKDTLLESKLEEIENAEEIGTILGSFAFQLMDSETSLIEQLKQLRQGTSPMAKYNSKIEALVERLSQTIIELEDIVLEAKDIGENIDLDPTAAEEVKERMDLLNTLMHKHHCTDVMQLFETQQKIEKELNLYLSLDADIDKLRQQIARVTKELEQYASKLTKKRKSAAPSFEKQVNKLLKSLKMEHASFAVQIEPVDELTYHGKDDIEFLFAPNKGSEYGQIGKIASGGEMSRLSLVTKSLVAGSLQMPTLVFDEIDSGVSGDVAMKMGALLKELSETHQVISITHSPQVAAKATMHYTVYKDSGKDSTATRVKLLTPDERIVEIATMLSSSPPSDAAIASAKELIGM